jgi:hypothetical protein
MSLLLDSSVVQYFHLEVTRAKKQQFPLLSKKSAHPVAGG